MPKDPKAILASFLAIDAGTIARDCREAVGNVVAVVQSITALRGKPGQDRPPEVDARLAHLTMVQAYALAQMDVEPEFKVFYAAFGAGEVVQAAEMASCSRGRLAEIYGQMAAIRKNEGLAPGEDWMRLQGPAEHRALEEESEKLFEQISDMMMVFVLRRYHLGEFAEMYEKDRRDFQIQRETAARVLMSSESRATDLMDTYLAGEYGQAAVDSIRHRVVELRARRQNKQ